MNEPTGKRIIGNLAGSVDAGVASADQVADFLARCESHARSQPKLKASEVARAVMNGGDKLARWERIHRVDSFDGTALSTLVPWRSFYEFHVDEEKLKREGLTSLSNPGAGDDFDGVQDWLNKLLALKTWWVEATAKTDPACLGGPFASRWNLWVSTDGLSSTGASPGSTVPIDAFREKCNAGLHFEPFTWLLRYSFKAEDLRAACGDEIGRPTFGDGGNEYFRVRNPSPFGQHCASQSWGTTVDRHASSAPAHDGRAERVALRVPLSHLPSLEVQLLGQVLYPTSANDLCGTNIMSELLHGGECADNTLECIAGWL